LWGRKAANKGLAKAEYAVGCEWVQKARLIIDYCDVGIGRPADPDLAKRWYQRAAAQGHKGAMQRLTEISAKGARGKRAPGRPTRNEASSECIVM
jgi:TPR repeat protein